jgi:aspartate aminotransferase
MKFQIRLDADEFDGRFTGMKPEQCKALAEKAHVYLTMDGRISMAGLNGSNIEYFAASVDAAVKGTL